MKEQVSNAIDNNVVLGMRVIFGSFLLGVYAFLLVALIVYFGQKSDSHFVIPIESNSTLITYLALGSMILAIPLSGPLFKRFLKTDRAQEPISIVANIRSAILVRLALFEVSALLAATAILVAALDGYLIGNPLLWINLIPVAYFTLHIITNFPSKSSIEQVFEEYY